MKDVNLVNAVCRIYKCTKRKSQIEYTNENFIQCTTGILSQVIEVFTKTNILH